jgi:fructokinase
MVRIGIDLGGTKISGVALAPDGRETARRRASTPKGDYEATVAAVAGMVRDLERDAGGDATVGVGMPGAISPATGLVKNANAVWMNGRPFDRDLSAALGRPVRVENDANCLAVSEATDGAGAGAHVVFAAILGTGCGAGIAIEGRPLRGRHAIAGEFGHDPLPWPRPDELPGPPCYCGRSGCNETWLSGTGFAADHARATGRHLPAAEIVARAEAGDADAAAAFERYCDRLARALAAVINLLDPDAIVLGGGMSNVLALYREVPKRLGAWVFSDTVDTPIRPARHGDDSGVRGAAWLWRPGEG